MFHFKKKKINLNILFIVISIIYFIICYVFILNYMVFYEFNKNSTIKIYSKIFKINYKSSITKNEIIDILFNHNYYISNKIKNPGNFIINKNSIILYRRSFNFPYKYENSKIIKIIFKKNKIYKILNLINKKKIKYIKIEPLIINNFKYNQTYNFNEYNYLLENKKFPDILFKIILLVEDNNFYKHIGIDFRSIIRAIYINIISLKIKQGASTITQQLSRNLFLNNKKNIIRKINEMLISFIIEKKYNKNKIIELYLNKVCLGQIGNIKIIGFPLASLYYFNKNIYELNVNELVVLVNMLRGYNLYNPINNYDFCIKKRNIILNKLKNNNIIDINYYNNLINEPIYININKNILNTYWDFIFNLFKEYKDIIYLYNIDNKLNNIIFSTLDIIKYNALKKSIFNFKEDNINNGLKDTSNIIIDRKKSEINALISSINYKNYKYVKKTYEKKHIGSLIKPIIYFILLDKPFNFKLNTLISDKPIIKKYNNKIWEPKNNDKQFRNKVTLLNSLIYSYNIPYINIGFFIGIKNILKKIYFIINKKEILNNIYPSIFLGSIYMNILDLSQIYQSILYNGCKLKLHSINNIMNYKNDNIYNFNKINYKKRVMSIISSKLTKYSMTKVSKYGTANKINNIFPNINIASKTGTTNNNHDNWIVCADNDNIFISWVGISNIKLKNFYTIKPVNIYIHFIKYYKYVKSLLL